MADQCCLSTATFNPHEPHEPQYQCAASAKLDTDPQDTRAIIATANRLLEEIFKPGYGYQKCGMQLSHIQPALSEKHCISGRRF